MPCGRKTLKNGRFEAKKAKLAKKVSIAYIGKKVPKKYQRTYGKRYSKKEALQVGFKVSKKIFG